MSLGLFVLVVFPARKNERMAIEEGNAALAKSGLLALAAEAVG